MLFRILSFALALFALPAFAGDGFDMPGSDYTHFAASSPFICRNSCGGDTQCKAWSWVKPGVQEPHAQCWLKSAVPKPVKDACCSSGARAGIRADLLKQEDHTDRPGADYKHMPMDNPSGCEATCNAEDRCAAWSYARPGLQGPDGQCWLKDKIPAPVEHPQVVSGVKYKAPKISYTY